MTIDHETIHLTWTLDADRETVWAAYADPALRSRWSVPQGESMVFDSDDLRSGGSGRYRCGSPDQLQFAGDIEYVRVVPARSVVHTETVRTDGELLSTGLMTWTFMEAADGTTVSVTAQVASFVGPGMLEGTRTGHRIALEQLDSYLRE